MTTVQELARELGFAQTSDLREFAPDDITNEMHDDTEVSAETEALIRGAVEAAK